MNRKLHLTSTFNYEKIKFSHYRENFSRKKKIIFVDAYYNDDDDDGYYCIVFPTCNRIEKTENSNKKMSITKCI